MSVQLLRAAGLIAALVSFSGCASSLAMQEPLSKEQIKKILADEKIEWVSSVEQQPQDDGTVSLLVGSNPRETSFLGCIADRTDLEVVQSDEGWIVNSMSEEVQLSLVSCDEARDAPVVRISGNYSDEKIGRAVGYLKELLSGSLEPELTFGSRELKDATKDVGLDDVHWVFVKGDDVEFQILSKTLAPRLLGIRFSVEGVRLKGVYLNDDNSIEVVQP